MPAAELARAPAGEPSASVAARVARARATQRERYGEDGPTSNAEADSRDVEMTTESHALAEQAMEKVIGLSPRGYTRVLRVRPHDRRSGRGEGGAADARCRSAGVPSSHAGAKMVRRNPTRGLSSPTERHLQCAGRCLRHRPP